MAQQMDQRRWEELNIDCLVNIFGRVGMESLLLDVPFVCKSWYTASLNPSCWQCLIFPDNIEPEIFIDASLLERFVDTYRIDWNRCSVTSFMKFVVDRSAGHAAILRLPACTSEAALKYVADACGDLKILALNGELVCHKSSIIAEFFGKWKNLQSMILGSSYDLVKILTQISIHCMDFCYLRVSNAHIGRDEAMAIVNFLPKLNSLILRKAKMGRDDLVTLLQGCKGLQVLDVSGCVGFDEDDKEISKLASHISNFTCKGSTLLDYDSDDYYENGGDWFDEVVYDGYNSD